jgi:hypothetical protein
VWAGANYDIDPYDTVPPIPANSTVIPGTIDAILSYSPSWAAQAGASLKSPQNQWYESDFAISRGPGQSHGISMLPHASKILGLASGQLTIDKIPHQMSFDHQSTEAPIPIGGESETPFMGRQTYVNSPPEFYTVSTNGEYMGLYGWRFISSFQRAGQSAQQTYAPTILEPGDELILGLDAGTFGPPDLDLADDLGDGVLGGYPPPANSLDESSSGIKKRLHKLTYLKEDYGLTLPHSRLKILTGDAELILIGDFISDESSNSYKNNQVGDNVTSYYGDAPVSDVNLLYTSDLLSGTLFTRVFTGSEGQLGVVDGNSDPDLARRFYLDLGARRS